MVVALKSVRLRIAVLCAVTALAGPAAAAETAGAHDLFPPVFLKALDETALDLIRIEACVIDWNLRVSKKAEAGVDISDVMISGPAAMVDVAGPDPRSGKYDMRSAALAGIDLCGSYTVRVGDTAPGRQVAIATRNRNVADAQSWGVSDAH